ncbi:uncharacterized protein [Rutidosis leptorrhynchoides]|uniref:uncharacterized protein n=1 Tax=Rutidosis leptorrhynchoides TaxID=125765 RepID=UPI003A9A3BC0
MLPQKIELFIWRVKQQRIPVKIELDKRGVDLDTVRCPVCNNDLETVEHIFIHCFFAKDLWSRVFRWWKINRKMYTQLEDMFKGIENPSQPTNTSNLWMAIEWVTAYFIWQNCNHTLFQNKKIIGPMALNEVQMKSFEWISRRSRKRSLDWFQWLLDPTVFDDHG